MDRQGMIRESILDVLIDDDESIIQVENYLREFNIPFSREEVVQALMCLLDDEMIKVVYPDGCTKEEFANANPKDRVEFWFTLTVKGHDEWETIEWGNTNEE